MFVSQSNIGTSFEGLFIWDLRKGWWAFRSVILLARGRRRRWWLLTGRKNGQGATRSDKHWEICCIEFFSKTLMTWSHEPHALYHFNKFLLFVLATRTDPIYGRWRFRREKKGVALLSLVRLLWSCEHWGTRVEHRYTLRQGKCMAARTGWLPSGTCSPTW